MTENKKIVQKYMDGFNGSNHEKILSCLNEDIVWDMPGVFNLIGKESFDKEIENPLFQGKPTIKIIKMVEENDIVIAEGSVKAKSKKRRNIRCIIL